MSTTRLSEQHKQKKSAALRPVGSTFVSTLALAACGGGNDGSGASGGATQSGLAIKGPLDDFRVFIDANGNGIYDAGEAFAMSGTDGAFSLQGPAGQTLHGEVTATTIDAASGRVIAGYFAAAPAGAAVMSPMTTVLAQTALSESDLRQALGLSVDLLSYNPFDAANVSTAAARDAEHVAQQLANITRALSSLGEGAGLGARPAFDIASNALNTVLVYHVTNNPNGAIDLWGDATIGAIMTAYRAGLEAAGHSTSVFDALRAEIDSAIDIVNQRILAVGNLTSTEARAVFGLPSDLYAQIKSAATAIANDQANPGLSLDTWAGLDQQLAENGFIPPAPPPPAPVFTVNVPTDTFTVQSDIDATLEVTGGGVVGNLLAGQAFTLTQQGAVTTGTLFARANGQNSAASAQTFTLGTGGNDIMDLRAAGLRIDYVLGGEGDDEIRGGEGNDHIAGGDGADLLFGNEGDDTIYGGDGADQINGGQSNDVLFGGDGVDTISGGTTGDDVIHGGGAADTLLGLAGNDTFVMDLAADFAAGEVVTGGAGVDIIRLDQAGAYANTALSATVTGVEIIALNENAAGFDLSFADGAYLDADTDGDGVTDTTLRIRADVALTNDVRIVGGATTVTHRLIVDGTNLGGNDTITGGAANDTLNGGAGNDIISGGGEADTLTGGSGDDEFTGGAGGDQFNVDAGLDTITDFGDGQDRVLIENGAELFATVTQNYIAAAGDLDNRSSVTLIQFLLENDVDFDMSAATATTNGITISAAGRAAATTIVGTNKRDIITGGNGDDNISGDNGNDSIFGGDGNDQIDGGVGDDTLSGGNGNDGFTIGSGNDTISDLNGQDIFTVAIGATVVATVSNGSYRSTADTQNSGGANENARINATFNATGIDVSLATVNDATTDGFHIVVGPTSTGAYIGSRANDIIDSSTNLNSVTIMAGSGDDIIIGSVEADSLNGARGADRISGGGGSDTFAMRAGDSIARTNETITANNLGNGETITFGNGVDVIEDFVSGEDKFNVVTANNLTVLGLGADGSNLIRNNNYSTRGDWDALNKVFTLNFAAGADLMVVTNAAADSIDAAAQVSIIIFEDITALAAADFI